MEEELSLRLKELSEQIEEFQTDLHKTLNEDRKHITTGFRILASVLGCRKEMMAEWDWLIELEEMSDFGHTLDWAEKWQEHYAKGPSPRLESDKG